MTGGKDLQIHVVDLETTGLGGHLSGDIVLEIGIVKLDTATGTAKIVYDTTIAYPKRELIKHKDAWIFSNSSLTFEEVENGKPVEVVVKDVRNLVSGKSIAIYNVAYDFEKFLKWPPFSLGEVISKVLPCIMVSATEVCRIPSPFFNYKWPTLEEAQKKLLPGLQIPSTIKFHRAASDAYLSALVLMELIKLNRYNLNGTYQPVDQKKTRLNRLSNMHSPRLTMGDFFNEERDS